MINLLLDIIKELWISSSYEDDIIIYDNSDELEYNELD